MRPSHTDGATTAPVSIRSSAHAAQREDLLPGRVKAVSVGLGSHPKQPAVIFIRPPQQKGRVFSQHLPQTFDVTVMDAVYAVKDEKMAQWLREAQQRREQASR